MKKQFKKQNLTQKIKEVQFDNIETKFQTVNLSGVSLIAPTSGLTTDLTSIPQGLAQNQRIGNSIVARSYRFTCSLLHNPSLGNVGSYVRIFIYFKKNVSGSDYGGSPFGLMDSDAYTPVYDSGIITLNQYSPTWTKTISKKFYNKRRKGATVTYLTNTAGSVSKNELLMYYVNQNADGSVTHGTTLNINGKMYFKDP